MPKTTFASARFSLRRVVILAAFYLAAQAHSAAEADDFLATPVSVVPVSNAPIAITKCKLGQYYWLSNNAKKVYTAMIGSAPTYQKYNPLGSTTRSAYEVDPKDDLGGMGSIIIPARGNVSVTATFNVGTDPIADPNDNRRVEIR